MARGTSPHPPPRKTGFASMLLAGVLAHPTASFAGLVMTATASVIMANALVMQPGAHPAPLFVGTRPLSTDAVPARPAAIAPAATSADAATQAVDHGLVADIQRCLKDFGYYKGDIDGLPGPQTSQAILVFERAFHLEPTGEPSNNVLLALRSVRPRASAGVDPGATDPMTVAALPATTPLPPPRPDRGATAPTAASDRPSSGPRSITDLIAGNSTPAAAPRPVMAAPVVPVSSTTIASATPAARIIPVNTAPANPDTDPRLKRIQQSLASQGFGPLEVDGRMSPATRDAIRQFQTYYSLPVTGSIDEAFLSQLVKVGGLSAQ